MRVNGKVVVLEQEQTLFDFLKNAGYDSVTIAVEQNGRIVPKAEYSDTWLTQEDTLEIVNFVGGG